MRLSKSLEKVATYSFIFGSLTLVSVLAAWHPVTISTWTHLLFPIMVMVALGMLTRFGYLKLSSLVIGRTLVILAALGWGAYSISLVYLILFQVNILEAVVLDTYKTKYLNAASGLLLLSTSFWIGLDWTGSYLLITNDSFFWWLLAYTVWNANFVTLQLSGGYYFHHFLILLSPILACLILRDFSFWLIFRETSLILGIATLACVKGELSKMERKDSYASWFENVQVFVRHTKTQLLFFLIVFGFILIQFFSTEQKHWVGLF